MYRPDPFAGLSFEEIDSYFNPEPGPMPNWVGRWDANSRQHSPMCPCWICAKGRGTERHEARSLGDSHNSHQKRTQPPSQPVSASSSGVPTEIAARGENERRISIEYLTGCLSYDPGNGALEWKRRPSSQFKSETAADRWNDRFAGQSAGNLNDGGYLTLSLGGIGLLAHRVAWALTTGAWPEGIIDHIDHNRSNNSARNLRDVSQAENNRNLSRFVTNTSGVTGVSWHKASGRWRAQIGDGKHLGTFDSFGGAVAARQRAETEFGYHANHGKHIEMHS